MGAERSQHGTGDDNRVLLFNAAHAHAEVLGAQDDPDTDRVQFVHQHVRNLRREPLLHLQAARVHLDQTGQFADPNNVMFRNLSNVHGPEEREDVMFAE